MATANLEKLKRALEQIDRPGTYCASGSEPAILPGLEVQGMGPVGLPLAPKVAKELIQHCQQAPYGKGEKTLVDTKVRRVWRLEPDHFVLKNPEWDRLIEGIVGQVQEALGLENQKLSSHLYDLLVYEKGSFFRPHRDGEKLDRMVATLVIVLPSPHEGGELIVRHEGQEQSIDFGGLSADPFRIHYAAFYADCEHEVKPLKKGYRLCLVYNLTLARSTKRLTAPREAEYIERIVPLIKKWAVDEDSSAKLGIVLDHQYTQDGLSWDALKGTDRARARVLAEAARQTGCRAYLTLVTLWEYGSAEYSGGGSGRGYRYGRRRSWYGDYDDEDDDPSLYEMGEVYESTLEANPWIDSDGNRLPLGKLEIDEDEFLDPESIEAGDPEEDFEGYTGNAGMTIQRWYRHAAIFLWPERRHFEVICSGDSRDVVPELGRMISGWKSASGAEKSEREARCRTLARTIVDQWLPRTQAVTDAEVELGSSMANQLLESLAALDAPELIGAFLGGPMIADVAAMPGKSIVSACRTYGWAAFRSPLESVMTETKGGTLLRNVRLLEVIATAAPRKKSGWDELCAALASHLIEATIAIDQLGDSMDWQYRRIDRMEILARMARALIASGQSERMSRFIDHTLATPALYPLTEVQVKAIVDLRSWLGKHVEKPFSPLVHWIDAVREQLQNRTAREPQKPNDFRRDAPLTCTCALCIELKQFLEDPREPVHRFRVRKELRQHIHNQINMFSIDLTHVTDRRGSPQTLVCTKTEASFQARLAKYHEDREHLATLEAIRESLPG